MITTQVVYTWLVLYCFLILLGLLGLLGLTLINTTKNKTHTGTKPGPALDVSSYRVNNKNSYTVNKDEVE